MPDYSHNFLYHVANYFYAKHGNDYKKIWLVFPNRRAGLFFRKYLSDIYNKPVFSPKIITISEFYQSLSGVKLLDRLTLLFELYEEYLLVTKKEESFDDFYFWGEMILNDFNDVDKSDADPKDLFRNIADLKEIDDHFSYLTDDQLDHIKKFWGDFNESEKSDLRMNFRKVWQDIYPLYMSFRKRLLNKGYGYEGMVLSDIVSNIKNGSAVLNFDRIYFIGHNALLNKEKELFRMLAAMDKVTFFWDYDVYYTGDELHEAGRIIRENIFLFPAPEDFPLSMPDKPIVSLFDNFSGNRNKIKIYPVNSNTGQTKVISSILNELSDENILSPEQNAVILPEEKLLIPLLNYIPQKFKNINITMGYPAASSVTYSLLQDLIELQLHRRDSGGKVSFYYKQVISILNHQIVSMASSDNDILTEIRRRNIIRPDQDFLLNGIALHQVIFRSIETGREMAEWLRDVLSELSNVIREKADVNELPVLEIEVIHNLFLNLNRLSELIQSINTKFDIRTFYRFFKQQVWNVSIPFSGEPVSGLQIMGILETRGLDFKNVIIPSLNEGIFPFAPKSNSFIPYSLRKGFGLPLTEFQDSIFAYYFYRLIQRAENVHLLYNSQTSGNVKEKSRYLSQLHYDRSIKTEEISYPEVLRVDMVKNKMIVKDDNIYNRLLRFTDKDGEISDRLSPSALTTYLSCSLKFYYTYISHIRRPDTIDEELNSMVFGNILHRSMQNLYLPLESKILNTSDIDNLLKDDIIEESVKKAFASEYFKDISKMNIRITGKNILFYDVIKKNVKEILLKDKSMVPFSIVSMENKYLKDIPMGNLLNNYNIGIKGYIDRVELKDGILTVVDYKTGGDDLNAKSIEELFIRNQDNKKKAILQVLLYAWLVDSERSDNFDIGMAIIKTRSLHGEDYNRDIHISKDVATYLKYSEELDLHLKHLIAEIMDRSIPFSATTKLENCKFCDFRYMCNRE